MSFIENPSNTPAKTPQDRADQAARSLETLIFKQMLQASGAFKASSTPGSSLHTDLFMDVLAETMAQHASLGFSETLTTSITPPPSPAVPVPLNPQDLGVLEGKSRVTSPFGPRIHPLSGKLHQHTGVDLAAPEGTAILAVAEGEVIHAGPRGSYGNAVEIRHADGSSSLYAHASVVNVSVGQTVARGEQVGQVGHSGRATGDHLHFELRKHRVPVSPTSALKSYGARAEERVGTSSHQPERSS